LLFAIIARSATKKLVELGERLQPRLFVFDPLARMKAAARKENVQEEMAALIEFLRHLREETGAAVGFVHHTGHEGLHMRGSSDLDSMWESRLTWKRDGQASGRQPEERAPRGRVWRRDQLPDRLGQPQPLDALRAHGRPGRRPTASSRPGRRMAARAS
jgi:AAA domain